MIHYPAGQILILLLGVSLFVAVANLFLKFDRRATACILLALAGLQCFASIGATIEDEYHLIAQLVEGQPEVDPSDPGRPVFVGSLKPIDGKYYPPLKPTNALFLPRGGGR